MDLEDVGVAPTTPAATALLVRLIVADSEAGRLMDVVVCGK